jgi:electron transfer flavoprotein beta subunit
LKGSNRKVSFLNYVVAMKQVPDLQQMRIRDKKPVLTDVPFEFGKIDKSALETAVQLKEANGGEVIVVSVGNEELSETLKDAMACGGDRANVIVDDDVDELQSADKALLLAGLIQEVDDVGLILFAEGSADNYSGQVGSRVAQILGYPQIGFASAIRFEGDKVIVTRALEDSFEEVEATLPAVVIVADGMNTPRLATVTQILQAGRKPKEIKDLSDVDFEGKDLTQTIDNLAPDTSRKKQELKDVEEIVGILKETGVVER